jgi:hypothetical protein
MSQQLAIINEILVFIGFTAISDELFVTQWARFLDPDTYRWSSVDFYWRIPGIVQIENTVGCDKTGWLFR